MICYLYAQGTLYYWHVSQLIKFYVSPIILCATQGSLGSISSLSEIINDFLGDVNYKLMQLPWTLETQRPKCESWLAKYLVLELFQLPCQWAVVNTICFKGILWRADETVIVNLSFQQIFMEPLNMSGTAVNNVPVLTF